MNIYWEDPQYMLLLLLLPFIVVLFVLREKKKVYRVILPNLHHLPQGKKHHLPWQYLSNLLRWVAIGLMIVGLARPKSVSHGKEVWSEGIDIVLVLDISGSMLAQDFKPDRAQAARQVAIEFVDNRPSDRIGVVLFAKYAFTQCPLTIDHEILKELLGKVKVGLTDPDNTAIGSALAVALKRFEHSPAKSKVIILLTDGENNFGLPPLTAAEMAKALGVRVYTIGVGSKGTAPYPVQDAFGRTFLQPMQISIDEALLRQIADMTGGKYYRATDENKLRSIFTEIDQMEKTRIEIKAYRQYSEKFYPWVTTGLILIFLATLWDITLGRRLV